MIKLLIATIFLYPFAVVPLMWWRSRFAPLWRSPAPVVIAFFPGVLAVLAAFIGLRQLAYGMATVGAGRRAAAALSAEIQFDLFFGFTVSLFVAAFLSLRAGSGAIRGSAILFAFGPIAALVSAELVLCFSATIPGARYSPRFAVAATAGLMLASLVAILQATFALLAARRSAREAVSRGTLLVSSGVCGIVATALWAIMDVFREIAIR